MSLTAGKRLGPYEIISPLGAGGMGEVYKAKDTRLGRIVAIKVLPKDLAANSEMRQRLEREARVVSQLSHPHICTLHDIGRQDNLDFMVMEFLDGETLAEQLTKGPLPIELTLKYAIQIADALSKAHRAGVIHRDLKPGNIMLTKTGAKLLDFGLAKPNSNNTQILSPSITALPTQKPPITAQGTILGTLQYMAPEQLEGREADARTDIFSLGAVIYEMATGNKAFNGTSQASLIASILSSYPAPISEVRQVAPPALDRLVKACLEKDPDARWQSAYDLMLQLRWIAQTGFDVSESEPAFTPRKINRLLPWAVALSGLLLAVLALAWGYYRAPQQERVSRVSILPPDKVSVSVVSISPDGRTVAFIGRDGAGKTALWVRSLTADQARPLPGTDRASYPFWSPDSRYIGFFASGKLKKIDPAGGPAQTLCYAPRGRGGSWNRDNLILFSPDSYDVLYSIPATGGEPTPITKLNESYQENSHRWPQFLPNGRHFLYYVRSTRQENNSLHVGELGSNETKRILTTSSNAAYAPPGYLLFRREGALLGQRFDADALTLTGEPYPITQQVGFFAQNAEAFFSVSETGVLVYRSQGGAAKTQFVWYDREGKPLGKVGEPGDYRSPWLSPDGKRLAVDRISPQASTTRDIWVVELSRGIATRFTLDPAGEFEPVWSPDGSTIAYTSNREGADNLYMKASSGAGREEEILKSADPKFATDWSSDGRYILYDSVGQGTRQDAWVLPLFGDRKPEPIARSSYNEGQGTFSPDARWIAYTSDESGLVQVYIQGFPASGGKWQVSINGGVQPKWRRDGKELFYLAEDGALMAVEINVTGSGIEMGETTKLFETRVPVITGPFGSNYLVTADGERFLVETIIEENSLSPIEVVLNWNAELK